MALTDSLNAALESAESKLGSTTEGQVTTGAETPGQVSSQPSADYIGFEPTDSPKSGDPNDAGNTAPTHTQFRIADGVAADLVVAFDGEKPVTAQEIKDSFFRQSDYSKKTAEIADTRKQYTRAIEFFEQNEEDIVRLYSHDPQERLAVFEELRERFQIPTPQARDAAGRYTSSSAREPDAGLIEELDPEDYDESSRPFIERWNAQAVLLKQALGKVNSLEETVGQFSQGFQKTQEQLATVDKMTTIADDWKAKGFADVNTDAAFELVGKPMTPEQAMFVAHLPHLLAHTKRVAQMRPATPHEPGSFEHTREAKPSSLEDRLRLAALQSGYQT